MKDRSAILAGLAAAAVGATVAFGSNASIPFTFTAGTPAVAAEVNANFSALKAAVDDNFARINDLGSRALTRDAGAPWRLLGDTVITGQLSVSSIDLENTIVAGQEATFQQEVYINGELRTQKDVITMGETRATRFVVTATPAGPSSGISSGVLVRENIPRAWATIRTSDEVPSGLMDGANILNVAIVDARYVEVTLATPMANTNYSVIVTTGYDDPNPSILYSWNVQIVSTTIFRLFLFAGTQRVDIDNGETLTTSVAVFGR